MGPLAPGQRITAIDMVRGFALFGVLLVNMYNFGASSPAWTDPPDRWAFSVMRVFFETKSWRLFSFLFGLGFSIQMLRATERGGGFLGIYLRRIVILFVIGMGHALFYDGDILMIYAILGLGLLAFQRVSPRVILVVSLSLLAVFPIERAVRAFGSPSASTVAEASDPAAARARLEEARRSHPYAVGSIVEVWRSNSDAIPPRPLQDLRGPESSLALFAMFLLGLYVGRRRIFQDLDRHRRLIRRVCGWGLGLGLLGMAVERGLNVTTGYTVFRAQVAGAMPQLVGDVAFAFGSTALALGYAAGITLLAQSGARRLVAPLAPVGRLALSVYLGQTLLFTTLFYGYAFDQVFRLGPAAVTAYALLFFALQIGICAIWARHFRFGPMEWLWRALTYGRRPPFRVAA
jgi:uncharacterized protein